MRNRTGRWALRRGTSRPRAPAATHAREPTSPAGRVPAGGDGDGIEMEMESGDGGGGRSPSVGNPPLARQEGRPLRTAASASLPARGYHRLRAHPQATGAVPPPVCFGGG